MGFLNHAVSDLAPTAITSFVTNDMSELISSLAAGAIGGLLTLLFAWHRLRRHHKSLQRGQDETVVNFSIEDFEATPEAGWRLRILSLEPEISIEDFVDNPALLNALSKAVRQTTSADPLVRFRDPYLTEALSRTIVNHVGGRFGWLNAFHVAGVPSRQVKFYLAPTWERGESVKWQKFRIIGVSQDQFDLIATQPDTWKQNISTQPGAEYQLDRLDTMAMIVREYQQQQSTGEVGPVAMIVINIPLAFASTPSANHHDNDETLA